MWYRIPDAISPGGRLARLVLLLLSFNPSRLLAQAATSPLPPPAPERCLPPAPDPVTAAQWLDRAAEAIGLTRLGSGILRVQADEISRLTNQSDRVYPPFITQGDTHDLYFSGATGTEFAGTRERGTLSSASATYTVRDTLLRPEPQRHAFGKVSRGLNPLAVLFDWRSANDARPAGRCWFRDYPRVVLINNRGERLYLDPKTGFPVKFERIEPHYLWGQARVEYLYTTWWALGPVYLPMSSFRMVEGIEENVRALNLFSGPGGVVPGDSAPRMQLPASAPDMNQETPTYLSATPPDTVRIGPASYLLRNRGYTEGVILTRDTVFVLDATQSEDRARQDSVWIGKLFPGRHPLVVVVSDLAWPHIAGVRFWVASGATIVSHRMAKDFLQRVVDRRWTLHPDYLESRRATARLRFRAVSDSLRLAAGAVTAYPIDGIGSEGGVMTWLSGDHFLFAGDFIQYTNQPSLYAQEVWQAAARAGLYPDRVAAQHLPVTPWATVDSLCRNASGLQAVLPGDPAIDGSLIVPGTITKQMTLVKGDSQKAMGTLVQEISRVSRGGRRLLQSVQTFGMGNGTTVDSALGDGRTLAPVEHQSHNEARIMRLDFHGDSVTGSYDTPSEPKPIAQRVGPLFDSNMADLVIAALPLGAGYAARVPLYIYEQGGLVWWDIRVTDGGSADQDAWSVAATQNGKPFASYTILKKNRRVVESVYRLRDGSAIRIEARG